MKINDKIEKDVMLEAIINSLPEMIFIFDEKKEIKAVNRAVSSFIADENAEILIESTFGEYINCGNLFKEVGCSYGPFCNQCFTKNLVKEVLEEKKTIYNREARMTVKSNGEKKELNVIFNVIPFYLEEKYVVLTIRDITELKKYEKQKIDDLEKLSFIGSAVSSIVHDLRNPLTGVIGYIHLIEKKYRNSENENIFKKIDSAVKRIKNLLEEILYVSSENEEVPLEKESVNLSKYLDLVIEEIPLHSEITREYGYKGEVYIDEPKMFQVFFNLIKNADEANGTEGQITVETRKKNGCIEISIKDTGNGIPAELKSNLFKPGKTFNKKNGRGFGLYSAKRIVEAHGGKIDFTTTEKGTEFFFTVPRKN